MARRTRFRAVVCLLLAAAQAGCGGDPAAPAAAPGPAATGTGTVAAETAPQPPTGADGRRCPVTRPRPWHPPAGVAADALWGAGVAHGNGRLWVGGLGDGGVIRAGPDLADGSVGWKLGWWRQVEGRLRIGGRRLDGPAAPLRSDVPDGYGARGFQASGVWFPTEGCWEVTGRVGSTSVAFVTLVTFGR